MHDVIAILIHAPRFRLPFFHQSPFLGKVSAGESGRRKPAVGEEATCSVVLKSSTLDIRKKRRSLPIRRSEHQMAGVSKPLLSAQTSVFLKGAIFLSTTTDRCRHAITG